MSLIREVLRALQDPGRWSAEGFEADDIIATLAVQAVQELRC